MSKSVYVFWDTIGSMSLGFRNAGYDVIKTYVEHANSVMYCQRFLDNSIEMIEEEGLFFRQTPSADVLAFAVNASDGNRYKNNIRSSKYAQMRQLIYNLHPKAFLIVGNATMITSRTSDFSAIKSNLTDMGYNLFFHILDSEELDLAPVKEQKSYVVGIRNDLKQKEFYFPEKISETHDEIFKYYVQIENEDPWYNKISPELSNISVEDDTFLCWNHTKYQQSKMLVWNPEKIPHVSIGGKVRKITHAEIAKLKGLPPQCFYRVTSKSWLYKALMYCPNVNIIEKTARNMASLFVTSYWSNGSENYARQSELLMEEYFQKHGTVEKAPAKSPYDFIADFHGQKLKVCVRYYSNSIPAFQKKEGIEIVCRKLFDTQEDNSKVVLVLFHSLTHFPDKDTAAFKLSSDVHILDVSNLLWMMAEDAATYNQLLSLLDYSIEDIEPKEPSFLSIPKDNLKQGHAEKRYSLRERLIALPAGKSGWREYEKLCGEILDTLMGEYIQFFEEQKKSNDGLYRFDLCGKIKPQVKQDFFQMLTQYYNTRYIIFEFKNNKEPITQKEIYTTEKYLYATALRNVAIIISRKGADTNAIKAAKGSLRENGKLILCLSDSDILEMLEMEAEGNRKGVDLLSDKLDNMLVELEK